MPKATLASATLGEDRSIEPPLGPLYIAASLESVSWEIDFRDYQMVSGADAFDSEKFVEFLAGHERILMISCFVDMLPLVIEASRKIKERRPTTIIILGGPGPTAGAAELLQAFPQIDVIVQGEGEETIREWAVRYEQIHFNNDEFRAIAGMVYRSGTTIVAGGVRARIADLSTFVKPAYHLLDWSRYTGARVITTRGCPYKCSFCDVAPLWGRRAVYRDVSETVDEMIFLRDHYGRREFAVVDDTFVINRKRVQHFCEELLDRNANLIWGCFGRINLMSEKLIALMARAGCRSIFYGIDSGSPAVLSKIAKEISADCILPILEISAKYFDTVEASFIWGYPIETLDDFRQTLHLAANASLLSPTVNVQLHMLSPLPSSPIFKEFCGTLNEPTKADQRWLLLPALLLDSRASELRRIVLRFPNLFPGFFTFPSPYLNAKRILLERAFRSLRRTLGATMLEQDVHALLSSEARETELRLLNAASEDVDRIGVGLALGVMRRARRSHGLGQSRIFARDRGASIVRVRNDLGGQVGPCA